MAALRGEMPTGTFLMLTALALASSLWVAAQEAGARADAQEAAVVMPVESIADDFGEDLAWIVGSHAADLYTTAWALHRGGGVEGNPFGPTPEACIALKMAGSATAGLTLWKLRRDGHEKTATIIRWVYVGVNGLLVLNNSAKAIRGK